MARDWLHSLWKASYKGTPFWVERDEENGGRRIVIHQFPMRDDPYLEDLGEDKRDFGVTAYVASDSADTDAGQLVATCATRGAGIVVLPAHGQIMVRCLSFSRDRSKDRHGYIAFSLKFVREGASSALASIAALANLVFVAADTIAVAAATSFANNFRTSGGAGSSAVDFVVDAAVDGLRDAVSILEAVRTSETIDVTASAKQRDAIQAAFDAVPSTLADPAKVPQGPLAVVEIARALGDAMPPASAVRAFEGVIGDFAVHTVNSAYPTKNLRAAAVNAAAADQSLRLAALAAYCEAIARITLADRPAGITLRANVVEFFDAEVDILPANEIDLFHAIGLMRDAVVEYLSRSILDLAPVISVEANRSMPSLFWAWRLYQDPSRSSQIVARNRVQHPSFMPAIFEALAR